MDDSIRIIETSDGSQSLYNSVLRETYHSTHGALTESKYVFIQMGLEYLRGSYLKDISILEVGLGTGLNALLSIQFARQHKQVNIDYHTLEPYPLKEEIVKNLRYQNLLHYPEAALDFDMIHQSIWDEPYTISENFIFTRYQQKIQDLSIEKQFDLVFYDAFAPNKQAEVWGKRIFSKLHRQMKTGAILVTYCAKGQFKRDLAGVGFIVETLDGPPGKKEMVRAVKSNALNNY